MQRIPLNPDWKLVWSEFCGNCREIPKLKWRLDAVVPGDVHLDLMRTGLIPDPFVGMNADHALWVEQKDWWFRQEFDSPADLGGQRAVLVFHGLDTFATVWLNGKLVGQAANMFIRHEFDVTEAINLGGKNELVVRLAAPAYSIHVNPEHKWHAWSPERLFCRKAQMSFGWDIAPRLVTVGIWRPVELVLIDQARITDFHVTLVQWEDDVALVRVEVETESFEKTSIHARLTGSIHNVAWTAVVELQPGKNSFNREVRIKSALRWSPIGYGKPALCEAEVSLDSAGRPLDARKIRTGLRAIELVQEPLLRGKKSFRFRCNGQDVFITGLNWTPLDAIFARITPERITETLEKLAGIGCNMLRVWGGGIYEPEHFYAECDRLGIMIWQDFMMACGLYPQTDEFAGALETEARQVVRDLRRHPCLAIWSGDNECDMFLSWGPLKHLIEQNRLTRKMLPQVCGELNPDVPYLPSSPWSSSNNQWDSQDGDTHCYCHGQDWSTSALWKISTRFMSEFGRLSLPSMNVIKKYLPRGTEWPLTNAMWRYHAADTTHTEVFRGAEKILDELKASGRPEPANIREAVRASQELQAKGVIALIEHYCANPEFGGFLLWNVADCWPQQSDSVIDCDGHSKKLFAKLGPLFKAVKILRRREELAH